MRSFGRLAGALSTLFLTLGAVSDAAPRKAGLRPALRSDPLTAALLAPPVLSPKATFAATNLAAVDRKLADLDAEEKNTRVELELLASRLGEARGQVTRAGRAFYRMTKAGLLPLGGGFSEFTEHAMRLERARRSLQNQVSVEERLRARNADLLKTLERVEKDRRTLSTERAGLDAERARLVDEEFRGAAFERAFERSRAPAEGLFGAGNLPVEPDTQLGAFENAKGRLLFPIPGRADAKPSRREGTSGPGLEIRAPVGSVVRAVFPGRVAFADRVGPYGRLVIVDHGDHYFTVSGNLASIDVKVGADLIAGERIGTVGDDGAGPMLYFEVRKGSVTIEPGPWLGIE